MSLFVKQDFTSHSGLLLHWKIECDALTDDDIAALALMLSEVLPPFSAVRGIPTGGVRIADALHAYVRPDLATRMVIVDDVLTTGASMEEVRQELRASCWNEPIGAVLFARSPCPDWITPLFQMAQRTRGGEGR